MSGLMLVASMARVVWSSGKTVPSAAPVVKFGPVASATIGVSPDPTVPFAGAEIVNCGGGGGGGTTGAGGVLRTNVSVPPPHAARANAADDTAARPVIRSD